MSYLLHENKRITRCKNCGSQVIYFEDEVEPIFNSIMGIIICPHCGAEIEVLQF